MEQVVFVQKQQRLMLSIEQALFNEGHEVVARVHGIHFTDDRMQ
jgi:hypothetical protein